MQYRKLEPLRMRIDRHEDSRIQGGIGATAAIGSLPRFGGLPSANRCQVLGRSSQFGLPVDESLSSRRRRRFAGTRSLRSSAQTHPRQRTPSLGLVSPFAQEFRISHGVVDRRAGGAGHLPQVANQVSPPLSQSVARRAADHAAEAALPRREQDEDEVQRWLREDWPRIKKVRRGGVPTSF